MNEVFMKEVSETVSKEIVGEKDSIVEYAKMLKNERKETEVSFESFKEVTNKDRLDDNGNPYRNSEGLLPNNSYTIEGYLYETDDFSRITKAEGKLRLSLEDRKPLTEKNVGENDFRKGFDDRGHLIGDRFGGSNRLENLVAMDGNVNKGSYKSMENTLANYLKENKDVYLKVDVLYEAQSKRPNEFVAQYTVNGEKSMRVFLNEREV